MHIISFKKIKAFFKEHPKSENPLRAWYSIVKANKFNSFNDIKQMFPSADQVKQFVVFNIGGNKYRLIVFVRYKINRLYIRHILTHKEYDKEKWKEDAWYNSKK